MPRPVTRDELDEMNLSPAQVEEILSKQAEKRERRYRYIVMLTTAEAETLSKQEKKEFTRATEWSGRWETKEVKTKEITT